jgi:hypothetical protein
MMQVKQARTLGKRPCLAYTTDSEIGRRRLRYLKSVNGWQGREVKPLVSGKSGILGMIPLHFPPPLSKISQKF